MGALVITSQHPGCLSPGLSCPPLSSLFTAPRLRSRFTGTSKPTRQHSHGSQETFGTSLFPSLLNSHPAQSRQFKILQHRTDPGTMVLTFQTPCHEATVRLNHPHSLPASSFLGYSWSCSPWPRYLFCQASVYAPHPQPEHTLQYICTLASLYLQSATKPPTVGALFSSCLAHSKKVNCWLTMVEGRRWRTDGWMDVME